MQELAEEGRKVKKQMLTFTITREMLFQVDMFKKLSMCAYCLNNTSCRHQLSMVQFSETSHVASPVLIHLRCDVCAKQCGCKACTIDEDVAYPECSSIYTLSVHQRQQFNGQLLKLRSDIVTKDPAAGLVGACVLSGLTNATIKRIIENCSTIESAEQLQDYGVTSH